MSEREKLADEYEDEFHRFYPDGMTVADYCNREVPSTCFLAGYDARDKLAREEMLEHKREQASFFGELLIEKNKKIAALKAENEMLKEKLK